MWQIQHQLNPEQLLQSVNTVKLKGIISFVKFILSRCFKQMLFAPRVSSAWGVSESP